MDGALPIGAAASPAAAEGQPPVPAAHSVTKLDEEARALYKRANRTKRMCTACHKKQAAVVQFWNKRRDGLTHLRGDDCTPTHCMDCAAAAAEEDTTGVLQPADAAKYVWLCKANAPAATYRNDGVVVLTDHSDAVGASWTVLHEKVQKKGSGKRIMKPLNQGLEGRGRNHRDPRRTWCELCPKWTNHSECASEGLGLLLSRVFFPHEFYALQAYNTLIWIREGRPDGCWTKNQDGAEAQKMKSVRNQIRTEDLILKPTKVNALARAEGLHATQGLHTDGDGLGLVAIVVLLCGHGGYQFCIVKGSHNLGVGKQKGVRARVPLQAKATFPVAQNSILVFPEVLLHGGGASSGPIGSVVRAVAETQWPGRKGGELCDFFEEGFNLSDLSVQYSFEYRPLARPPALDNYARPNWHHDVDEEWISEAQRNRTLPPQRQQTTLPTHHTLEDLNGKIEQSVGEYGRVLDGAFPNWLGMLRSGEIVCSTKRRRSKPIAWNAPH